MSQRSEYKVVAHYGYFSSGDGVAHTFNSFFIGGQFKIPLLSWWSVIYYGYLISSCMPIEDFLRREGDSIIIVFH